MSRRFITGRAAYAHLDWTSQPLVQSVAARRRGALQLAMIAFAAGLMIGLVI